MDFLLSFLENPTSLYALAGIVLLGLIIVGAFVFLFGRDVIAGWFVAIWKSLRGGTHLLAIMLILPMAACASFFPQTDSALKAGNIGAVIGNAIIEGRKALVATCSFLDAETIVWRFDLSGAIAQQSGFIEDTREDRRAVCHALGGSASASIQAAPTETE